MNRGTRTTQEFREITCVCGQVTVIVSRGLDFHDLRCWACPKEPEQSPILRLVKE